MSKTVKRDGNIQKAYRKEIDLKTKSISSKKHNSKSKYPQNFFNEIEENELDDKLENEFYEQF